MSKRKIYLWAGIGLLIAILASLSWYLFSGSAPEQSSTDTDSKSRINLNLSEDEIVELAINEVDSLPTGRCESIDKARYEDVDLAQQTEPIQMSLEYLSYDIWGDSPRELQDAINDCGMYSSGKRFSGHANWHVNWWWNSEEQDERCVVVDTKVRMRSTVHMPRLLLPLDGDMELRQHWLRYYGVLLEHEHNHIRHAIEAAEEIKEALEAIESAESCTRLRNEMNMAAREIMRQKNAADDEYDERTNHGRSEGAVLVP